MTQDAMPYERPRRRGWERRRDLGRRMVRDRRRDAIPVFLERRAGMERRSSVPRRSGERRDSAP